jgi:hypothetical protein
VDQDGEPSDREPPAPEVREVDAVEAEEIRLYGVGVLTDQREEARQFPSTPTAFWRATTRRVAVDTVGFVALKAPY